MPLDATERTQTCHKNAFGLNYTLPMFNECLQKQHTNGSMVQIIPKLIPVPPAANGCPRRKGKLGIPPGYRICKFPGNHLDPFSFFRYTKVGYNYKGTCFPKLSYSKKVHNSGIQMSNSRPGGLLSPK